MAQEPMNTGDQRTPEEIRRDIAATRADMDRTMDRIETRVSPSAIRERQTARMRGRWSRIRTSVMGAPQRAHAGGDGESVGDRVRTQGQQGAEALRQAPDRIESQTRGNPLAAGAIAFGVGALVGSLLPASRGEQEAATALRDRTEEPLRQELRDAGERSKEELQPAVSDAADRTKERAGEAAQRTRDEAQQRARDVGDRAREGAQQTRES